MIVQGAGIHDDILSLKMEREAVQAPGGWTIQVFPIRIVV